MKEKSFMAFEKRSDTKFVVLASFGIEMYQRIFKSIGKISEVWINR
jgi:hypothetical protein